MRIIQITASYKPAYIYGGPIVSVGMLCETLVRCMRSKHTLEVLTTTANGKFELEVVPNRPVPVEGVWVTYYHRLTKDHTHFSPSLLYHLYKKLRHDKSPTVVHIHAWWNLVSMLSCLVAKWTNTPVVLSPRGMLTDYTLVNRNSGFKKWLHQLIGKSLLKYVHIHATTELERSDIERLLQPRSIAVLPNLVDIPENKFDWETRNVNHTDGNTYRLIFLSRIEEKKGLDLLLEGLTSVAFNWSLTIAGTGETKYVDYLKNLSITNKIDDRISWVGQIPPQEKFNTLASHDLLCLTSYNENFANVVIESLSAGTPVFLSNKVGLASYVKQNQFGWCCDLTVPDIVKGLTLSFEDKKMQADIRAQAPAYIRKDFIPEQLGDKYLSLYQHILDGRI